MAVVAMNIKTPLEVFISDGRPATRIDGRMYRWSPILNRCQDVSTYGNGRELSNYYEMKWRGELGVYTDCYVEKWEFIRE